MGHRTPLSIGLAVVAGVCLIAALVYAMAVKHENFTVLWVLIGVGAVFAVASWIVRLRRPR
jgi:predicted signal transduction protein with EAL and GGDEF domain